MNRKILLLLCVFLGVLVTAVSLTNRSTQAGDLPVLDEFTYLPIIVKPVPQPQIVYFRADVEIADPGDTIVLSWHTQNATAVTLYHMMPSGQFGQFWNVAATGTMSYTISPGTRNVERFHLYADNDEAPAVGVLLELPLTCPHTWFFAPEPPICPQDAALETAAAEQQFEHGWMIWLEETDQILVIYNDAVFSPRWSFFTDDWEQGMPVDDPTIVPPTGFYQPQRGFGLIWREMPSVRDRLGWAVDTEQAYTAVLQRTSYSKYNETYILALDEEIWKLKPEHSGWEKFPNEK